jgi:predicted SAM-dependent methyltransferase
MTEAFRILRPGGVVRVVVPDLAIGARKYLKALEENPNDENAAPVFLNWLQLCRTEVRDPHRWIYDAPSLSAMLREIGFIEVGVCDYRVGRVPDCETLDNRPDESVHIEAQKPQRIA